MPVEPGTVDANVLVYAFDTKAPQHAASRTSLDAARTGTRKSGVPDRERDHFVVVYHGEADLKRIVHFQKPDDAYVLLLDKKGEVRWTAGGPVTDTVFAGLKSHVAAPERP